MSTGKEIWLIDRFYGGMSPAEKEGPKGSFYYGDRLDLRTDLSAVGVNIKSTKDSGTVVTGLPKWIKHDPTNDKTYAYDDAGDWYIESGGSWTKQTQLSTAAGQGMTIWNDYVYFRKTSALSRYGPLSGSPSLTQSWQTSNVQTESLHAPVEEFQGNLYFANGRFLGEWDGSTWTYNKITLPIGWKIRSLAKLGEQLVLGGWQGTNVYDYELGFLWFWNGTDTSVTSFIEVPEGAINAMTVVDNNLYFIAGAKGALLVYTGAVTKMTNLCNTLGQTEYLEIFPGAMGVHQGVPTIGLAGNSDSTTSISKGVYSYGRVSKNYPRALNIDHLMSTGTKTGTTCVIGSICPVGPNEFYFGWRDNTSYGIDKVSGTTPYGTAIWHSLVFDNGNPYRVKAADLFKFTFKPLAANETIDFYYQKDRSGTWTSLGTASTTGDTEKKFPMTPEFQWKEIQIRADLKTSGSTAPEMLSAALVFTEINQL